MLLGLLIILAIGFLVGLISGSGLAGFFTVGGLVVLWGLWGMVQSWLDFHGTDEEDNSEK